MNKKIFAAAILLAGSFFISCEEDDKFTKYEPVNYIEGKWELTEIGTLNSQNVINYTEVVTAENCFRDNLVFDAGTSFVSTDFTTEGTACNEVQTNGSFAIESGNLVLTSAATASTFDITAFTNTTMDLVFTDEETGDLVFYRYKKV